MKNIFCRLLKKKYSRKIAFTLAEVLVTLGIIGVVAAITMPTLIDNHQKKVAATRLEKFYSMMSQAYINGLVIQVLFLVLLIIFLKIQNIMARGWNSGIMLT